MYLTLYSTYVRTVFCYSEDLDMSAFKFVRGSRKLQRKMWWQNVKVSACI
jgi:hypothetical protein